MSTLVRIFISIFIRLNNKWLIRIYPSRIPLIFSRYKAAQWER